MKWSWMAVLLFWILISSIVMASKAFSGPQSPKLRGDSRPSLIQGCYDVRRSPHVVILVGKPGCGKSTFCSKLDSNEWEIINQDTLGNRKKCEEVAELALSLGRKIVIDRTNADPIQRAHWIRRTRFSERVIETPISTTINNHHSRIEHISESPVHSGQKLIWAIELDVATEVCIQRCENRINHPTVKPTEARKIVGYFAKAFVSPSLDEGLDCCIRIAETDGNLYRDVITAMNPRLGQDYSVTNSAEEHIEKHNS